MKQHEFTASDRTFTLINIPESADSNVIVESISLITNIIEQDGESFSDIQSFTYDNLIEFFEISGTEGVL